MNKILFLLGIIVSLNSQAGVAIVNENNSAQLSEISLENETIRAEVIKVVQKYRTLATRGQCRAFDGSGRQVCEPGEIYERTFLGYEVTYQYKDYIGTYFTQKNPGAWIYLKVSLTPSQ